MFKKTALFWKEGFPYSMPCCGLVGGCGARAVSRKTPIYFMYYRAAWAAKEMQLSGFTRIAVRANIFCFTIFALWMDIERTISLKSMNGLPTMGQYYSELCIFSFWAMYAILSLPGHLGSFLGTLFLSNTSCQWQNETWITKFCMQNFILKRLGDNFHKKCLNFITLPANLTGTQFEMSYRQHWHPAVSLWEKINLFKLERHSYTGWFFKLGLRWKCL